MSAGDGGALAHTPVLLKEALDYLRPAPGQTVVDATLGGGGHAAALVRAIAPNGRLVGVDRDPAALQAAAPRLRAEAEAGGVRLHLVRGNYADLATILRDCGVEAADAVLFDLGVSSPQLDEPARGFTYRADAPLDMRMDPDQVVTAYHLVNGLSGDELAGVIRRYGEERWASRIASFIVRHRRERGPITTTGQLVDVILAAVPAAARRGGPHPARRTFQALRIAVNRELDALEAGLAAAVALLRPGGRVVAISYHSLEDRIVKTLFRELARGCTCPPDWPECRCGRNPEVRVLVSHPVRPSEAERAGNPRARSAKLRAAMRLAVRDAKDEPPAGPGTGEQGQRWCGAAPQSRRPPRGRAADGSTGSSGPPRHDGPEWSAPARVPAPARRRAAGSATGRRRAGMPRTWGA